jgi:hypothetical protein
MNNLILPNDAAAIDAVMKPTINYNEAKDQKISLELAHRRLGHISMPQVKRLLDGKSLGMTLSSHDMHTCDDCKRGQMKAKPFPKQPTLVRSLRPFDLVHTDLLEGPERALGEQYKWLLIIIDDYTRFSWCYGLADKNIGVAWASWRKHIDTHHGRRHGSPNEEIKIAGVRADPGGEYLSNAWTKTLTEGGSTLDQTISGMHFQVGVAERSFRDVVDHAVSILSDANLPERLWFHVAQTVVFLKNLWPHSHLQYDTPYERMWGRKPDLSFLRVIGSKSWVFIPKEVRGHKFLPRAKVCRLLGYISSGQYVFWDQESDCIVYARHVDIDEYNSILADDDAYINDNHADDDLDELNTRLVGESYAYGAPAEAPDQPSPEEREQNVNINDLVDQRLGDEEAERAEPHNDDEYVPNAQETVELRAHPRRKRKASQKSARQPASRG